MTAESGLTVTALLLIGSIRLLGGVDSLFNRTVA